MNKADLYHQNKNNSVVDSEEALQSFENIFKWRSDGGDSVLDAGCGSGDVTYDVLLPFLPANFKRLVGVDISKEMIKFAQKKYTHPKLAFQEFNLDVAVEEQSLSNDAQTFDHIFSFFTLHWIQNQKQCMENFYKLLNSGGDMLLMFLAHHPAYDVYMEQSLDPKWAPYMNDAHLRRSPYHCSNNPAEEFRKLLNDCGFTECDVKVDEKFYNHTLESLTSIMHSVNPFVDRIPVENRQEYLNDLIEKLVPKCKEDLDENNERRILLPYKLLIAYARK